MKFAAWNADVFIKLQAFFLPIFKQFHSLVCPAKIFQLHLFELARAKREIARINVVSECFTDLRNTERQLLARHFENVYELNEDRLGGLGAQVCYGTLVRGG